MILSNRKVSEELAFYRVKNCRGKLSEQEEKKLSVLERGYSGECMYDEVFDEAGHDSVFIFRDIYLKIEDSVTQYDALIVSDSGIVVNEVKNFSGDYRYENSKWFYGQFQVPEDPTAQLKRSMGKLLRIKYNMNIDFGVTGKLIFPNVEFRLKSNDEELWNMVIMRSNLRQYLMGFQHEHISTRAEKIAEEIRKHIVPNPYFNETANFEKVKKGFYCGNCGGFSLEKGHIYFECLGCNSREKKETHLLRAISDFSILFSNERMTKKKFMMFVDYKLSSRSVLRMLNKYCQRINNGAYTYYKYKFQSFDEAYNHYEVIYRYKDVLSDSKGKDVRLLSQ